MVFPLAAATGHLLSRGMPAMIGREEERGVVQRALRATELGQGGVILIEGEPGSGKSRLLADTAAEAAGHGFTPFTGRCEDLGQPIPLAPLLRILVLDEPAARPGQSLGGL